MRKRKGKVRNMIKRFYERPTQVMWFDYNRYNEDWENDTVNESPSAYYTGGIAFEDKVICAECGGVEEIEDIIDETPEGLRPIVDAPCWVAFEEQEYFLFDGDPYWAALNEIDEF